MNQSQYSGEPGKQRDEESRRRREARLDRYLRVLDTLIQARREQAAMYAVMYTRQQTTQAAQPPPDDSKIIEGTFFVVGAETDGLYRQGIERIKTLRQAVFRPDARIIAALAGAFIADYYGWHLLALGLLGLAGVLFYLKFVRAVKAKCPHCQKPFGSAQKLPTKLGSTVCQNCGLPIEATR